jgi:hypothetical protein
MDNPELDLLTNLYQYPLTPEEKALRWKPECSYFDQLDFERWIVGRRRVKFYQDLLEKHLQEPNLFEKA